MYERRQDASIAILGYASVHSVVEITNNDDSNLAIRLQFAILEEDEMCHRPGGLRKVWFGPVLSLLIGPIAFGGVSWALNSEAAIPKTPSVTQSNPAAKAGEGDANQDALIAQGKKRYQAYKCYDCHGQNGKGTDEAPDLTHSKKTAEEVSKFLVKPSSDAQNKGMPDIPLDSPDHKPLVAYVMSLRAK